MKEQLIQSEITWKAGSLSLSHIQEAVFFPQSLYLGQTKSCYREKSSGSQIVRLDRYLEEAVIQETRQMTLTVLNSMQKKNLCILKILIYV